MTVGIVPQSNFQSILFFLKTNTEHFCSENVEEDCSGELLNTLYTRYTILYNSNTIIFEENNAYPGLVSAAFDASTEKISESKLKCKANGYCDDYSDTLR